MAYEHQPQTPEPGKEAIIYRRASTDTPEQHNKSLEQQETACRNACEANGFILVEVFREAGNTEPGTSLAEHT